MNMRKVSTSRQDNLNLVGDRLPGGFGKVTKMVENGLKRPEKALNCLRIPKLNFNPKTIPKPQNPKTPGVWSEERGEKGVINWLISIWNYKEHATSKIIAMDED